MLRTILIIYMIFFALPSWGSDLQNAINKIFPNQIKVYGVKDKEYFLEILSWLDSRAIKKSSEKLKQEYDKVKRQSSGKRGQPNFKSRG